MPFLESCQALAASLPDDDINKMILDFLLSEGVGRKNAQSWPKIETHLRSLGLEKLPSKEAFQTGLLKRTREGDEFIGSTGEGFFIIESAADAEAMRRFYSQRIISEVSRLGRLEELIDRAFPIH